MSINQETLDQIVDKTAYDFYRCYLCKRLITSIEMEEGLKPPKIPCAACDAAGCPKCDERGFHQTLRICPCGSMRFSPSDIAWHDWFKPRVLYFAYLRIRGLA